MAFADPLPEPDWADRDAVVDYLVEGERLFAGPDSFDEAGARDAACRTVDRTADIESSAKNHWLIGGGDDTRPRLGEVTAPTLVIHRTDDPFLPPGHGETLVREIADADLLLLDGAGHQVPPPSTYDVVVPPSCDTPTPPIPIRRSPGSRRRERHPAGCPAGPGSTVGFACMMR